MRAAHRFSVDDSHFLPVPRWIARLAFTVFGITIVSHRRARSGRCDEVGVTVIENTSGKPERIMPASEWDTLLEAKEER